MFKVTKVIPKDDGNLLIELSNGRKGIFDVTPYMNSDFFSALKNQSYFNKVNIFFDGIGWPEGQDIGPDTINALLIKQSQ